MAELWATMYGRYSSKTEKWWEHLDQVHEQIEKHEDYLVMNSLVPVTAEQSTAPIYAYAEDQIISTIVPGDLGIPVLKHLHLVWPHYVTSPDGSRQLYILMHGWRDGKFAVLKHEPSA